MNINRRGLLLASSGVVMAASLPASQAEAAKQKGISAAGWNDGLAHPIPYRPSLGSGKERGLVLGGGGT